VARQAIQGPAADLHAVEPGRGAARSVRPLSANVGGRRLPVAGRRLHPAAVWLKKPGGAQRPL
jgi:hypothetical protein